MSLSGSIVTIYNNYRERFLLQNSDSFSFTVSVDWYNHGIIFLTQNIQPINQPSQTLKHQTKIAADNTLLFFLLSMEIRLDVLCESSAQQRIHMKYQVLFSLKNIEKVFISVVCCSRAWCFKG